ncbi:unnamed protein product [Amoebophrya sp. A25]|nr:unnamed protein product [Amoebophrya sp. A25]|eukprot:GSA25T00022218001.1
MKSHNVTLPESRYYSAQGLSGKTALITGATAGIGEAIACRFAELGLKKLVLCGRRTERLDALKQRLMDEIEHQKPEGEEDSAGSIVCVTLDVTDKKAVEKLAQEIGVIDILVNNAGLALGTNAADETPYEDTMQMFQTNVIACAHLTSLFGKKMREQAAGHLVYISSVAGKDFYEGGSSYCATKHAIRGYADALRCDLVGTPLRVTTISPGLCDTEFSVVRFKGDMEKAHNVYANIVPLCAADIADQVTYAVTRPPHVQIADILCYPTNQAHAKYVVSKQGESLGAAPNTGA